MSLKICAVALICSVIGLERPIFKTQQFYRGIPVFGSKIVTDGFNPVFSQTYDLPNIHIHPHFKASSAIDLIKKKYGIENVFSKLVIYPKENTFHLAWHLNEKSFFSRMQFFIDAHDGTILDSYNQMAFSSEVLLQGRGASGELREFYGSQNKEGQFQLISGNERIQTYDYSPIQKPGRSIASENAVIDHPQAVDAHYYTEKTKELLNEKFDIELFKNPNFKLISTVNYIEPGEPDFPHSFWNGRHMVYGAGGAKGAAPSGALDLVAHEITHAIIENTSNLVYYGQSGALNESLADILGTYVEYHLQPDKFDWTIAEDTWTPATSGDALRYMNNPTKDGTSRDHYDERYTGTANNGGVHRNSGISNLAFYLAVEGGQHPRYSNGPYVQGLGMETAMQIFFKAYTELLAPRSGFMKAREATLIVAQQYGSAAMESIQNAWAAVGVGEEHKDIKGLPPATPDPNPAPEPTPEPEPKKADPSMILVNASIPDANSRGVTRETNLNLDTTQVSIKVNIEHPHMGDIQIRVKSPAGKIYTLYNREDGRQDNLERTFVLNTKSNAKGKWKINVRDRSSFSTGKFVSYKIW